MKAALLSAVLALSTMTTAASPAAPRTADQWYARGQAQLRAGQLQAAADAYARAAQLNPSAANWRALADVRVRLNDYDGATTAYGAAIQGYRARGDAVTARALETLAAPYRQDAGFYVLNAATPAPAPACQRTLAKFEPAQGLYLGMYVDEQGISSGGEITVGQALGDTSFAVYFRYFTLRPGSGEVFPTRLAQAARRAGGALHIALEPGIPLAQVTEAALLPFARAARAAGVPVFLRFAGEFNDPANEWSRDPALYRAKFRLVHDVMAREAPNVAMVWMAMPSRLEVLDSYFPGDDVVDWVGLSLYSVPFQNGERAQPGLRVNPLDVLDPLYAKYACKHPIQVSEYASSHRSSAAPGTDYTGFATGKLRELYWGAALKYPRLKNINWLNLDMLTSTFVQSRSASRRNDYRLQGVPTKAAAFRELLDTPYFRTRFGTDAGPPPVSAPQPFPRQVQIRDTLKGALWLKTFDPPARVTLTLDGRPLATAPTLPYRFQIAPAQLPPGAHTLALSVTKAGGQVILKRTQAFVVQP